MEEKHMLWMKEHRLRDLEDRGTFLQDYYQHTLIGPIEVKKKWK